MAVRLRTGCRPCNRLVRDRHEAEDVVQEAYARAFARWSAVSRYHAPQAWVRTVALRLAVSRFRRPSVPASAGPTAPPAPSAPPVEDESGLVREGHDVGFVRSITDGPDGPTLVLDRAVLLSGDETDAEAAARGLESPVPNDVLVLNDNPRLREYPVRPDAAVTLTVGLTAQEPTDGGVESSLGELRALLPPGSDSPDEPVSGYLFDVVVQDGVVVSLDHVYLP